MRIAPCAFAAVFLSAAPAAFAQGRGPADPSPAIVEGPPPAAATAPAGETAATGADPIPSLADDAAGDAAGDAEDRPEALEDVGERPGLTGDESHRIDPAGVREPITPAHHPYRTGR